jgi:hypothetical protein
MNKQAFNIWINYFLGAVWFVNGFFCKVLNFVPRHQKIVARILDIDDVRRLTLIIGYAEIGMAIWIISGMRSRLNAIVQILIIATMNALEFFLAPDLLLWGKANAIFAFMLLLLIWYKEFYLMNKKKACYHS